MDQGLVDLLSARAAELAARLEQALLAEDAPHYREAPAGVVRERCDRLVAAFLEALRASGPDPFVRHVRAIAAERAAEGFLLREVQLALSSLEAQVWPIVAGAGGATSSVVRRLAVVTGIVGRGKDELARSFLEQKEHAEARAVALQQRLETLFRGTEPTPTE
jgi:hypothetical protein